VPTYDVQITELTENGYFRLFAANGKLYIYIYAAIKQKNQAENGNPGHFP
jgi:hypothetical protein